MKTRTGAVVIVALIVGVIALAEAVKPLAARPGKPAGLPGPGVLAREKAAPFDIAAARAYWLNTNCELDRIEKRAPRNLQCYLCQDDNPGHLLKDAGRWPEPGRATITGLVNELGGAKALRRGVTYCE